MKRITTEPFVHKEVSYCCKNREGSKEDMDRISKQPIGYREVVDCINCRGQFEVSNNRFGLHIGILSQ